MFSIREFELYIFAIYRILLKVVVKLNNYSKIQVWGFGEVVMVVACMFLLWKLNTDSRLRGILVGVFSR